MHKLHLLRFQCPVSSFVKVEILDYTSVIIAFTKYKG